MVNISDGDGGINNLDPGLSTTLAISNIERGADGGLTLTWRTQDGPSVTVDYSTTLQAADWQPISVDNTTGTFTGSDAIRAKNPTGFHHLRND